MKDIFFIYDTSCIYEIVTLNYFMKFTDCDMVFCSLDGKPIKAMEGYSINVDMALKDVNKEQIRSFIVPGGDISSIDNEEVRNLLQELKKKQVLIAGICAGVDVLEHADILSNLKSTHSTDGDMVNDNRVITARANAYIDFAIEVAKELDLFDGEEDIRETIEFWKNHKRME